MNLGWTYPERSEFIQKAISSPVRLDTINFQSQSHMQLPVLFLEIGFPKYRLRNGRTYALQAEYLSDHPELDREFFRADPELNKAQSVQHTILKQLIHRKNLDEYFEKNDQEEPLILDIDGFVINGNRRLCAMREIHESNKERFVNIECLILPKATDEELDELESRLQIHPDIKDDYGWISEILKFKDMKRDYGYQDSDLSKKIGRPELEIKEIFSMLEKADIYLESRNMKNKYGKLSGDEYLFREMIKQLKKMTTTEDRELFEKISYCLVDHSADLGSRAYSRVQHLEKNFKKVKEKILNELVSSSKEKKVKSFGALGDVLVDESDIYHVVDDNSNSKNIKEIVIDVIDEEKHRKRKDKTDNAALYLINDAKEYLENSVGKLQKIGVGPEKVDKIESSISSIENSIVRIKNWVEENR